MASGYELTSFGGHLVGSYPGEGHSAIRSGGASGSQPTHFGTTGGDFALVKRLPKRGR